MHFHKVTIAAIFICQVTLVPETLMSNYDAIFHVAINSLNAISENCSHRSTDIKKTYSLAISDLTSVFYQQNEKITELEVDNVHLKDEIEYLREKLSKSGEKLNSRTKREARLDEYTQWPGFPSPNRKRKKSNEQARNDIDALYKILNLNERRGRKKLVQESNSIYEMPEVPYVMQRLYGNDNQGHPGLREENTNTILPVNYRTYERKDEASRKIKYPGFHDVFRVNPRIESRNSGTDGYIASTMKPMVHTRRTNQARHISPNIQAFVKPKVNKPTIIKPRALPMNHDDMSTVDSGTIVNIVDDHGKSSPHVIVQPNTPGGMCQIVQVPEIPSQNKTEKPKKPYEDHFVHLNFLNPVKVEHYPQERLIEVPKRKLEEPKEHYDYQVNLNILKPVEPVNQERTPSVGKGTIVNIVDDHGKSSPHVIVQPHSPGDMCQIVQIPEIPGQNKTKTPKKPHEDHFVHLNYLHPVKIEKPKKPHEDHLVHLNYLHPVKIEQYPEERVIEVPKRKSEEPKKPKKPHEDHFVHLNYLHPVKIEKPKKPHEDRFVHLNYLHPVKIERYPEERLIEVPKRKTLEEPKKPKKPHEDRFVHLNYLHPVKIEKPKKPHEDRFVHLNYLHPVKIEKPKKPHEDRFVHLNYLHPVKIERYPEERLIEVPKRKTLEEPKEPKNPEPVYINVCVPPEEDGSTESPIIPPIYINLVQPKDEGSQSCEVHLNLLKPPKLEEPKTPSHEVDLRREEPRKPMKKNYEDAILNINNISPLKPGESKTDEPPVYVHILVPVEEEPEKQKDDDVLVFLNVLSPEKPEETEVPTVKALIMEDDEPTYWERYSEEMVQEPCPEESKPSTGYYRPNRVKPKPCKPNRRIPVRHEEQEPDCGVPREKCEVNPECCIPGETKGMKFVSSFSIPGDVPSIGGAQNQGPGSQGLTNVYGNYVILSAQNQEQQKQDEPSSRKLNFDERRFEPHPKAAGIPGLRVLDKGPEDLVNNKESNCPQLRMLNDSSCNCTPCDKNMHLSFRSLITEAEPQCNDLTERSNLHDIAKMGCSNLMGKIISKKNVNLNNENGLTPLHLAAERGNTDLMNILITAGANINALDNNNNTALHYCASGGSANACRLLLSKGSKVKAQNVDQATPLHLAVWKGNYEIVKLLLNYNDTFDITDKFGRSPSDLAQEMNYYPMSELLEKSGVKSKNPTSRKNICGRYPSATPGELTTCAGPLVASTISDSATKIKITKRTVAPISKIKATPPAMTPNTTTEKPAEGPRHLTDEESVLFDASKGKWLGSQVTKMCEKGVNVNVADVDSNSSTALHLAATIGIKLTTLILIKCGADVNIKDLYGNTPLHNAVMNGKYWVADILLHNKANPLAVNNKGETPQKIAHSRQEFAIRGLFDARLLRWYNTERKLRRDEKTIHQWARDGYYLGISLKCTEGVDINIKNVEDNHNTALHLAVIASKNNEETVLTLLRCGANIHSRDRNENTPLHLAIIHNQPDIVITLLINNADPLVPNKEGKTPFQLGQMSSDPVIKDTFTSDSYSWYMGHYKYNKKKF